MTKAVSVPRNCYACGKPHITLEGYPGYFWMARPTNNSFWPIDIDGTVKVIARAVSGQVNARLYLAPTVKP